MKFEEELEKEKNPSIKKIGQYLLTRKDIQDKLDNPKKSLKEMFTFVTSEARKQATNNSACIEDEVVYGWAVHYYDEDNIKVDKMPNVKVATDENVKTETTKKDDSSKELEKYKKDLLAKEMEIKELKEKLETKPKPIPKPKKVKEPNDDQMSLF